MTEARKKVANVMGWPIGHSLSPRLHGFWIKKYDLNAAYNARAVKAEDLERMLRDISAEYLKKDQVFRGTNLTIPLKEVALDIVDILDPSAARIGAVNTVVIGDDGALIGRNTDGIGFIDSLKEHINADSLKGGTAVILGAGGAARAVATALVDLGLGHIHICNRSTDRAKILADHIGSRAISLPWDQRSDILGEADILVNTTSLGMSGQPPLEISLAKLKTTAVVIDIVYVPLETELLKAARAQGNLAIDGLGMLLHQAKAGFTAWFGVTPEVDADLRRHVLEGLG
ncbi:MAG: shikimate dehydrogenase [Sneathiella sp.]|nr:MAG: shikimate dehydrogenase [Sneathiella sp.]